MDLERTGHTHGYRDKGNVSCLTA